MNGLTHLDETGLPTMVDVASRTPTPREATAMSCVSLPQEILALRSGDEILAPKGPVFATAIVAGTMAVKRTSDLIPFCHPLIVDKIRFRVSLEETQAVIFCTVACTGKTGVEMEALTGASVAALVVYDMCKAVSLGMVVKETRLVAKSGGKRNFGEPLAD